MRYLDRHIPVKVAYVDECMSQDSARLKNKDTASRSARGTRESIVSYIESEIANGRLQPGQKVPSRVELAERFNVSRQTVTTAIRSLADRGVVVHTAGRGVHVAEAPSSTTRGLTIGVIGWYAGHLSKLPDVGLGIAGYWEGAFKALSKFAHENGHGLLLIPQTDCEPLDVESILAYKPDVIVSIGIQLRPETVFELRRHDVQLLMGNRQLEHLGVCYVDYDTEGDFRRMVRIFHDRGHERIAVIMQQMRIASIEEQCFGAFCSELAMRECVYPYRQYWRSMELARDSRKKSGQEQENACIQMLELLDLPEPTTAVYCRSKHVADGVLCAMKERGLAAGRDISILVDGDETTSLSSFALPQDELGKETVEMLKRMIANPHRVYQVDVPKPFVERGSIERLG